MIQNAQLIKQGAEAVCQRQCQVSLIDEHDLNRFFLTPSAYSAPWRIEGLPSLVLSTSGHHQGEIRQGLSTPNIGQETDLKTRYPG